MLINPLKVILLIVFLHISLSRLNATIYNTGESALISSHSNFGNLASFRNFENHGIMMWIVDPNTGVILDANKAARQFFGYDQLAGMNLTEINTLPDSVVMAEIADAYAGRKHYFESRHILADGTIREVEVYSYNAPFSASAFPVLFSIIIDVTEKKLAARKSSKLSRKVGLLVFATLTILLISIFLLWNRIIKYRKTTSRLIESEGQYQALFNGIKDLIIVCSPKGDILKANQAAREILGQDALEGQKLRKFITKDSYNKIIKHLIPEIRCKNNSFSLETQLFDKNGTIINLEASGYIKYDENKNMAEFFVMARDINIHKELNRKILQTVIKTEERERQRIAQELHDGIGPLLSGLKMHLQLDQLSDNMSQRQVRLLSYAKQLLDDAIEQTRSIAKNLTTATFYELGLEKAFNTYINKVGSLGVCEVKFNISPGSENLDANVSLMLYRIGTELINNALKHAYCNEVVLHIEILQNLIILFYCDDGKSFDVSDALERKENSGMGIANIFNRVRIMNGQIVFERNKSGKGMYATIRIPLQTAEDKSAGN